MTDAALTARLGWTLAATRISLGAFLLMWTVMKVLQPERAQNIFAGFYGIAIPEALPYALAAAQAAIVVLFLLGLFKTLSYGAVLAMHGVSTLSTLPKLLDPFTGSNLLFWAAVPVLALCVLQFSLREQDVVLTLRRG